MSATENPIMRRFQAGMTLLELMIALLIIGILTGIAVPSYRAYVMRTNRTDAKTSLLATAAALERCYTRFSRYNAGGCNVPASAASRDGLYTISVATPSPATFALTAVPQGKQAGDTGCANFGLDQANTRTVTGSKPAAECWGR
jgi:type IV pilus assembly protein PilE